MTRHQSAEEYPVVWSDHLEDIIETAMSRAKFWKYPAEGPWTVIVLVNRKQAHVKRNPGQGFDIFDHRGVQVG